MSALTEAHPSHSPALVRKLEETGRHRVLASWGIGDGIPAGAMESHCRKDLETCPRGPASKSFFLCDAIFPPEEQRWMPGATDVQGSSTQQLLATSRSTESSSPVNLLSPSIITLTDPRPITSAGMPPVPVHRLVNEAEIRKGTQQGVVRKSACFSPAVYVRGAAIPRLELKGFEGGSNREFCAIVRRREKRLSSFATLPSAF